MKFFRWLGNLLWWVMWGRSGQTATPADPAAHTNAATLHDTAADVAGRLLALDNLSREEVLAEMQTRDPALRSLVLTKLQELREQYCCVAAPPPPDERTPEQKHRQAQLDWQARFQNMVDGKINGCEPLTQDSPGLPFAVHLLSDGKAAPLLLRENNTINAACLPSLPVLHDNSEFPAYLRKLHDEALETDEGELAADRQLAAERYAKKKGIDLEDPQALASVPAILRPHVRYIDPKKVRSQHYGPVRESTQKRSGGNA